MRKSFSTEALYTWYLTIPTYRVFRIQHYLYLVNGATRVTHLYGDFPTQVFEEVEVYRFNFFKSIHRNDQLQKFFSQNLSVSRNKLGRKK